MKTKRVKHVKKVLAFYQTYFKLRAPYHTIVDGTFCRAALANKVNIRDQLPKYFDAEVKLYTTSCAIKECESLGSLLYGPLKILKQYDLMSCGHEADIPAAICLARIARKQKKEKIKYIIATQDQELSENVRKSMGVPLLYLSQKTLVLEGPSEKSKRKAAAKEQEKIQPSEYQFKTLEKLKLGTFGPQDKPVVKKKKKLKGPNPLSCKKKTKKRPTPNISINDTQEGKKIRKRKRRKRVNPQDDVRTLTVTS